MKKKIVIIISILAMTILATVISGACVWQPPNQPNDGRSAFEIWLEAGHEGTYEDFLEWLRRPPTTPQSFILSFENTSLAPVTAPQGTLIWQPSDPARALYRFEGWYKDTNFAINATFPFMLNYDTTLYARWTAAANYDFFVIDINNQLISLTELGREQSTLLIPASVTIIGHDAFNSATLTTVTFEEDSQLTIIGSHAFFGATNLTSITIPASLTWISGGAFANTSSLSAINIESGNIHFATIDGVLYNIDITTLVAAPGGISVVNIPASVIRIGNLAFEGATSLTTVTFEEGSQLTSIEEFAFSYVTSLVGITIPASVLSIGRNAFHFSTNLTTVIFEEGSQLENIGDWAFSWTTSLTEITIPASVTIIGSWAFYHAASLTTITFEEGSQLTSIGSSAFRNAISLTDIAIPASVRYIGESAFMGAISLTTVTFEEDSQLRAIESETFWGATSLTSINIPNLVFQIGDDAFRGATSLTRISISYSVILIGARAFWMWTTDQTIYIHGRAEADSRWHANWLAGSNANVVFFWLG